MSELLAKMNQGNGVPNLLSAGILCAVMWAGNSMMELPEKIETMNTNQQLILYRLEKLEKA